MDKVKRLFFSFLDCQGFFMIHISRGGVPLLQSLLDQGLLQSHCQYSLEVSDTINSYLQAVHIKSFVSDPHIKESTKLKAPAYTFGGRFKSTTDKISPSPNSYNTTGLTKKGRICYLFLTPSVCVFR